MYISSSSSNLIDDLIVLMMRKLIEIALPSLVTGRCSCTGGNGRKSHFVSLFDMCVFIRCFGRRHFRYHWRFGSNTGGCGGCTRQGLSATQRSMILVNRRFAHGRRRNLHRFFMFMNLCARRDVDRFAANERSAISDARQAKLLSRLTPLAHLSSLF